MCPCQITNWLTACTPSSTTRTRTFAWNLGGNGFILVPTSNSQQPGGRNEYACWDLRSTMIAWAPEVVKRLSADQPPDMTGVRAEVHTTQIANFEGKREEEREIEKAQWNEIERIHRYDIVTYTRANFGTWVLRTQEIRQTHRWATAMFHNKTWGWGGRDDPCKQQRR